MPLYDRIAKVSIGESGTEGLLFASEQFRIAFDVNKSMTSSADSTYVQIYNLSKDTLSKLQTFQREKTQKIIVEAGYKELSGYETIGIGEVSLITLQYQPPDEIVKITFSEGGSLLANTTHNYSYSSGIDAKSVITKIANDALKMDIDDFGGLLDGKKFVHGVSLQGTVKEMLNNIVSSLNLNWTIDDNKVKILNEKAASTEEAIVLDENSGLLGIPEQDEEQGFQLQGITQSVGWKVTSLLNPKFRTGNKVVIKSKIITGTYRIESVEHKGDTRGQQWQSLLEVSEV